MAAPAAGGAAGAAPLPVIPAEADDASYSKTAAPAPAKRAEPKKSPDSLDVEDVKQLLGTLLKVAAGFVVGYFAREIRSKIKMGKPNTLRAAAKTTSSKPAATTSASKASATMYSRPKEELKMMLVVNEELKMGKGKIGAQCAHAAAGVISEYKSRPGMDLVFRHWEYCGQPKICLKGNSTAELDRLQQAAAARGLPTYTVHDAGRTQVAAGSQTVLAIGPAEKSRVDEVTSELKLL